MNYCLYASRDWIVQSYGLRPDLTSPISPDKLPRVMHSGLTNWPRALNGVFDTPLLLDQLAKYDVVHANIAPTMVKNVFKLRRLIDQLPSDKSPLLVVNPDHALEMWESFTRFDLFLDALRCADRVFTVHHTMSQTLESLLGTRVHTLPHPTNVELLRELYGQTPKHPEKIIVVIAHHYDQNYLVVTETLRAMRRSGANFKTILVGHMPKDPMTVGAFYDDMFDALPFDKLMALIAMSRCVIDTAFTHSYGRIGVECAALGIPCIGHSANASVYDLHADFEVDIFNAREIAEAIERALDRSQAAAADYDGVARYNYANSAAAFTEMCYGA